MKYIGIPRSIIPKAATESTGSSMSGRITSNTAANNMNIGIGRNTYIIRNQHLTFSIKSHNSYVAKEKRYTV